MEATVKLTLAEFNKAVKDAFTEGWNSRQRGGSATEGGAGFAQSWDHYFQQFTTRIANDSKRKRA